MCLFSKCDLPPGTSTNVSRYYKYRPLCGWSGVCEYREFPWPFWAKMVPKIAKRSPKGTIFGPRWWRGAPRGPLLRQDGAQDSQEEPQGDHFWAKMMLKIAKRSPRGLFWGQDGAQDRPKMARSRTWATLNASVKLFKAKVAKSVRVLLKTRIWDS